MKPGSHSRNLPWILAILFLHSLVLGVSLYRSSYLIDDSIQYLTLADNLLKEGSFSQSYQPPLVPDVQRTPGYPVFLAMTFNHPGVVLILQHLMVLLSGFLLYRILREQYSRKLSRWLSGLYMLQPYPILFASVILSESLFITLFLAGFLFAIRHLRTSSRMDLALSLGWMSLAAYVRPVGLPLLVLLMVVFGIRWIQQKQFSWTRMALLVLIPFLLLGPWMVRNQQVCGKSTFNSMGDMGMIHGRLGGLEAQRRGEDFHEHHLYMAGDSIVAMATGLENLRNYYSEKGNHETELYHPVVKKVTFGWFFKHPGEAIQFQFRALGQMLGGVGFGWANKVLGNRYAAWGSAGIQLLFNLMMYAGLLLALLPVHRLKRGDKQVSAQTRPALFWVALLLITGGLLVSAAAWADGRYRMILDPLFMVLLAEGWMRIKTLKKSI